MKIKGGVSLISAERTEGGLMIMFDNGKCAFFSTALLLSALDRAEVFTFALEDAHLIAGVG